MSVFRRQEETLNEQLQPRQFADDEFRVDGKPSAEAAPPELAAVGAAASESFHVEAARIDGDFREVRVTAL